MAGALPAARLARRPAACARARRPRCLAPTRPRPAWRPAWRWRAWWPAGRCCATRTSSARCAAATASSTSSSSWRAPDGALLLQGGGGRACCCAAALLAAVRRPLGVEQQRSPLKPAPTGLSGVGFWPHSFREPPVSQPHGSAMVGRFAGAADGPRIQPVDRAVQHGMSCSAWQRRWALRADPDAPRSGAPLMGQQAPPQTLCLCRVRRAPRHCPAAKAGECDGRWRRVRADHQPAGAHGGRGGALPRAHRAPRLLHVRRVVLPPRHRLARVLLSAGPACLAPLSGALTLGAARMCANRPQPIPFAACACAT